MTGYHTRWARPEDVADDPKRIAIREALAFGKALYDIRNALGMSVAELAIRAALTDDDIERIEEGGTEPTIPLLRRLAAALDADVHLAGGHDLGSVWFGEVAPRFTGLRAISSSAGPRRAPSRRPRHWAGKPVTDG
jgi:transcriptional regulator with XRE-family HTH domain